MFISCEFKTPQKHDESEYEKARKTCKHKECSECGGTGLRKDGSQCIHMIACYCKWCHPF